MNSFLQLAVGPVRRGIPATRLVHVRRLCSGTNESGGTAAEKPPTKQRGYGKAILVGLVGASGLVGGLFVYSLYDKKFLGRVEDATGMKLDFLRSSRRSAEAYLPFLAGSSGGSEKLSSPTLPTPLPSSAKSDDSLSKPGLPALKPSTPEKIPAQQPPPPSPPQQQWQAKKPQPSKAEQQLAQLASQRKGLEVAMELAVTKAIAAETRAKQYAQQFKQAMASKSEADWAQVKATEAAKTEALECAKEAGKKAEQLLAQYKAALDDPKVQNSQAAKSGLSEYKTFMFELDSVKANVDRAVSEARIMREYKAETDKQQQQQLLRSEVDSLLPLDKRSPDADLSREDLQLLIAHAHSKILELQKQVEEFEDRERRLVQQVMDKSAAAGAAHTEATVERELKHQMLQWEEEKRKLTQQLRDSWEQELQQQLSRQAAAHTSHVTQLTRTLRDQLAREHQADVRARLLREHEEFEAALQGWTGRVRGIESAVEGRAGELARAQRAQQLWLAAHSMRSAVAAGRSFQESLEAVKSMAGRLGQDDTVAALTAALPRRAVVSSEEALVARFARVKRACARVALVPETGGSLWLHALSRVQSALMLRRASKPLKPEDPVDPASPPSLFDWLDTAEAALAERGDLETAVRAMARLPGLARLLADDWIRETRAHLEARQTAAALCALAAAMGLDAATQHRLPVLSAGSE